MRPEPPSSTDEFRVAPIFPVSITHTLTQELVVFKLPTLVYVPQGFQSPASSRFSVTDVNLLPFVVLKRINALTGQDTEQEHNYRRSLSLRDRNPYFDLTLLQMF